MSPRKPATLRTKWLGKHLRQLRDDSGMTLAEAGEHLNRDASAVSRYENGGVPVPRPDLEALLDLYGVNDEEFRVALFKLRADSGTRAWWDAFGAYAAAGLRDMAWAESIAEAIHTFSAVTIDGLLQTPDYARAVTWAVGPEASDDEVTQGVEVRMMRQSVLADVQFRAVIHEAVLRCPVGGAGVAATQARFLTIQGQRDNIEIRVLPFSVGAHASPGGAFRIYEMPDPLSEVVCVDGPGGVLYLEPPKTTDLVERYDRLWNAALGREDSAQLIEAIAQDLERT